MIPYTTPSFEIAIPDADLSSAQGIYVTIEQRNVEITKSGEAVTVDGHTVSVWLTQEESSAFKLGDAQAQVNWIYVDAVDGTLRRASTLPLTVRVDQQLYKQVIE